MSEDRLEEIKSYGKSTVYGKALVTDDDIEWLMSELEKSRAEIQCIRIRNENLKVNVQCEIEKCRKDIADWKDQATNFAKDKLHYQGRAIKAEDEVKRLKAMLAIGHFVIRDN